ncbi:unnamed protein product [Clavelina lepadiformis]|uniref:NACHT domain-containing protein n=1 Tax=Clavelina lepadiformis TaxID=159417 RepID=A0ABP0GB62_CLALP
MEQNKPRTFTTESSSCATIAESSIERSNVIQDVQGGVNINQTTINQQPQPSTSQASQPQSSDRKNHSKSISKQRTSAGNIVTNFFHGVFPFFILSNLEKTLKKHAKVVCGEIIHPIKLDFAINTVDLELSQRVPQMPSDDEGHYNKRDEVVKAWESVKGNIELKDLFTLATNFAEKEAERFGNLEAKQDYINKNKNTVVLIGQAGMGKTTLAKTIINLVTERQLLPECKFLFYIPFRAVDFLMESNFLDFVLRCFQSEWSHNVKLDFVLLKKLSNDPNVLFIFDGLDEADTDYFFSNNTLSTCDLYDNYTPDIFIANILSGNIFANAKKLLTSRPRQFFELDKAYLSGCVVNILGLSVKSQAKLCKQLCKEKYDAVQNYLSRNPLIDASCFVPAKCIIIYGVLTDSFNSSLDHDIQSLTDIFVRALYYYSKSEEHVRKPEELQKLCDLAWNGFQARKIIFTESDISNVKISSETLETFLTTSTKIDNLQVNLLQGKKQSSFSHLIWHELFTAIHLILHVPSVEFQNHLSCFLESRWEVVALFVFGLCNRHVQTKLNDIFNIAVVDVDMKFQQLDNFVSTAMVNLRESFQTSTFIEICNWIYQLNNRKLTEKVAALVPKQILLDGRVHLTDLCNLDYLLQYAQSDFSIRFGESLSFTYNAIYRWFFQVSNKSNEVFCQNLIREIIKSAARQPDSSADNLLHACRLLYDKSEDSNAKEMVQYFPQLVLLTKPPSFDQITHLMYLIIQSTSSFKVHIKCNSPTIQIDGSLDPDEVITLVAFLHLVQEPWQLQMNEKKITSPTKVEHLLQVMMDTINKNSRRKVEIKFSPEEQAVECNLSGCGISSQGTQTLAFFLLRLPYRIKRLNLRYNDLGDDGASHILTCLSKIEELHIGQCKISASGITSISNAISKLPEPMKKLDLYGNNLGDDGASHISTCLSKIEELHIGECDISASGIKCISDAISKLPEPIHYLDLSENKFGDAGVPFIMSCLDKIEKLYMTDCNITEEGVHVIIERIKNCSNLPNTLEFNYDKMNRSKVLRCGLDQLGNGNFSNLDLTPVGWEALAAAINKLPQPNMDSENVSRLYKDLQTAHPCAEAFSIKKEGASPRVDAKISGIYQELLDAYLFQDDIAVGNLERQEFETTHREFTERLAAVSDVSDSGGSTHLRNTTKQQAQEMAEQGKGKDIQQEAERQFQEANQAAQDSIRKKQQELYLAQEIVWTRDQATAYAASSVAECLDPASLLQPSSPIASPDASVQLTKATDLKVSFLGSAARISNQTPVTTYNTPAYAHPLFQTYKMPQGELDNTPMQVIPVRLLPSACQITTSRITAFLEHILQTISVKYYKIKMNEYFKHSQHYLQKLGTCKIAEPPTCSLIRNKQDLFVLSADVQSLQLNIFINLVKNQLAKL